MLPGARLLLGTTLLALTLTGTVAAQQAQTPQQRIAARKMTICNGPSVTVHFSLAGLGPIEALAYRRLEYLENQAELLGDWQRLSRLEVQEDLRNVAQGAAPPTNSLALAADGGYAAREAAKQNFGDLERAYLDVLDIERKGLELARPQPRAGAKAPTSKPVAPTVIVHHSHS